MLYPIGAVAQRRYTPHPYDLIGIRNLGQSRQRPDTVVTEHLRQRQDRALILSGSIAVRRTLSGKIEGATQQQTEAIAFPKLLSRHFGAEQCNLLAIFPQQSNLRLHRFTHRRTRPNQTLNNEMHLLVKYHATIVRPRALIVNLQRA